MTRGDRLLNDTDRVVRSEALLTAEVDGQLLAMSVDQGLCFGLDPIGTRIWALIAEPRSIGDICARLVDEFDVDPATCRKDVVALLSEMWREGMVNVGPEADAVQ